MPRIHARVILLLWLENYPKLCVVVAPVGIYMQKGLYWKLGVGVVAV